MEKTGRLLVDPTGVDEIDEIDGYFQDQCYSGVSDDDIANVFECYLNIPEND